MLGERLPIAPEGHRPRAARAGAAAPSGGPRRTRRTGRQDAAGHEGGRWARESTGGGHRETDPQLSDMSHHGSRSREPPF